MNLYVESSAALGWLLDEDSSVTVRRLLAASAFTISSDLTLIECDRVLHRAVSLGGLSEPQAADRRAYLRAAAAHWQILRIAPEIVDRARQSFPAEPIRSLDAIHLASLLVARSALPGLGLLSLDERVRRAATSLGVDVAPASLPALS